jgi:hypothetical protein
MCSDYASVFREFQAISKYCYIEDSFLIVEKDQTNV